MEKVNNMQKNNISKKCKLYKETIKMLEINNTNRSSIDSLVEWKQLRKETLNLKIWQQKLPKLKSKEEEEEKKKKKTGKKKNIQEI